MIIHDDAVFVGVPKTGSRSIHEWLEREFGVHASLGYEPHTTLRESGVMRAYRFGFCRNPYDRIISWLAFDTPEFHLSPEAAIRRAVEEDNSVWMRPQHEMLEGCNVVYRFEQWGDAVRDIQKRLGIITEPIKEHESIHALWQHYFQNDALRALVHEHYKQDFEKFGYEA